MYILLTTHFFIITMPAVTTTGERMDSAPKKQQSFIIAPTQDDMPSEMLILDNFNKIQFGGSRKIAVLGAFLHAHITKRIDVYQSCIHAYVYKEVM